ncbi:hypothetical protein [Marinomonas sp. TW1]|uniref:hypothetical protein n=1 Tax=Marinomonas sp. TW1 TaxID=1561203 RepID=UPI0007AF69ED|nr:hypothetical protein [Marinomonas sp. TW1]KZN13948.1 hypothetical protein OA79_07595 [Marinomonas sp. TW1]
MSHKTKKAALDSETNELNVENNSPIIAFNDKSEDKVMTVVINDGKALGLNTKKNHHIFYQLAYDQNNSPFIRMTGNEGGGLHTKSWIDLLEVFSLLEEQEGKAIKSTLLTPVFKSGSANNCGFFAAVLRNPDIGLLSRSDKSVFVHRLSEQYAENKEKLLTLNKN